QPALDGLVYRSTLLARDRSVVNIYGGNTSAKLTDTDHVGRSVDLLWVKGSGGDMAAITEAGFAGLRLAEILPLLDRTAMTDEEMVEYLTRCAAFPNRPRQSIETLLHAFLPARHVDHTHPDAVISLACARDGQELCRRLWGPRAVWVDYTRPGFIPRCVRCCAEQSAGSGPPCFRSTKANRFWRSPEAKAPPRSPRSALRARIIWCIRSGCRCSSPGRPMKGSKPYRHAFHRPSTRMRRRTPGTLRSAGSPAIRCAIPTRVSS